MAQPRYFHLKRALLLGLLALCEPLFADAYNDALYAIRARDYPQAYQLLWQLGNQGHVDAQYQLAAMYRAGTGTGKDHGKAAYWYRKAAEQGHVKAQYNLGVMYENGWGIAQSEDEAGRWYRLAAEQGHRKAKARIAGEFDSTADAGDKPVGADELHRAVIKGSSKTVERILNEGVSVDIVDDSGSTPLIRAAELGHRDLVEKLLARGANVQAKDAVGDSALLKAASGWCRAPGRWCRTDSAAAPGVPGVSLWP